MLQKTLKKKKIAKIPALWVFSLQLYSPHWPLACSRESRLGREGASAVWALKGRRVRPSIASLENPTWSFLACVCN